MGIGTVYQEVNLLGNLTVAENLFLGRQPMRFGMVRTREMEARAKELLAGYGLDIDVRRSLSAYPVAVQQIIAIARAADLSGKVLILDEPTASLDTQEVEMLFDVVRGLRARGLGIVFISHFLDQVYEICDTVTILRNGRKVATRAALGLPRLDLVALMLGRDLEAETRERVASDRPDGDAPLQFRHFGRKGHVAPFDLSVHAGEVVGMAGLLGSGRTETAEVLFGAAPADTGEARMDGRVLKLGSPVRPLPKALPSALKTASMTASSPSFRSARTSPLPCRRGAAGCGPCRARSRWRWPINTSRHSIFAPPAGRSRSANFPAATSRRRFWPAGWRSIPSSSFSTNRHAALMWGPMRRSSA